MGERGRGVEAKCRGDGVGRTCDGPVAAWSKGPYGVLGRGGGRWRDWTRKGKGGVGLCHRNAQTDSSAFRIAPEEGFRFRTRGAASLSFLPLTPSHLGYTYEAAVRLFFSQTSARRRAASFSFNPSASRSLPLPRPKGLTAYLI
jgi:hypothetical protein